MKTIPLFVLSLLTSFIFLGYQQGKVEASELPLHEQGFLESSDPDVVIPSYSDDRFDSYSFQGSEGDLLRLDLQSEDQIGIALVRNGDGNLTERVLFVLFSNGEIVKNAPIDVQFIPTSSGSASVEFATQFSIPSDGTYELWIMGSPNIYYGFSLVPERLDSNIARTSSQESCASEAIQESIARIVEDPMALDELITCDSSAVPFILEALPEQLDQFDGDAGEQAILLVTTLSEIGSAASEAQDHLIQLLETSPIARFGDNGISRLSSEYGISENLILYTLERIGGANALQRIAQDSTINAGVRYLASVKLIEEGKGEYTEPILQSILENPRNDESLRHSAAVRLIDLDQVEIAQQILENIALDIASDLINSNEHHSKVCILEDILKTLNRLDSEVPAYIEQDIGPFGCTNVLAGNVRATAVQRLQSSRPAICQIPTLRAVFSRTCR